MLPALLQMCCVQLLFGQRTGREAGFLVGEEV